MKTATIYAVAQGGEPAYAWKWRCDEQGKHSAKTFTYYYDCLTDAREHGYAVELAPAHDLTDSPLGHSLPAAGDTR